MEVVYDILVCLQLSEVGENFDIGPLTIALGGPAVVILRDPSQEGLAVDGAGATDDPTPLDTTGSSRLSLILPTKPQLKGESMAVASMLLPYLMLSGIRPKSG